MTAAGVPEDGDLRLAGVTLGRGKRVTGLDDDLEPIGPVAWVTDDPIDMPGLAWEKLSAAHAQTGLVPVLFDGVEVLDTFNYPAPASSIDRIDAAERLASLWESRLPLDNGAWSDPEFVLYHEPFTAGFPGLADAELTPLPSESQQEVLSSLPPALIGLVPAVRPADILTVVGWSAFDEDEPPLMNAHWIGAVLRSWEDRFGARMLRLSQDVELTLHVERPPRSPQAALRVAAEHFAFADTSANKRTVTDIAAAILNAPLWTFWWD